MNKRRKVCQTTTVEAEIFIEELILSFPLGVIISKIKSMTNFSLSIHKYRDDTF